jgi:hypothetical protein
MPINMQNGQRESVKRNKTSNLASVTPMGDGCGKKRYRRIKCKK